MNYLLNECTRPYNMFYNGVHGSYYRLMQNSNFTKILGEHLPLSQLVIKASTNKGKDIGGKLILIDAYLKLGIRSDYLLLLHDKTSPYRSNSLQWRKSLLRIVEKENQDKILALFNDPKTGIVASANMIRNEQDNEQKRDAYTDSQFIKELRNKYQIQPPHLSYVAGTMFWVRAALFEKFFKQYPPLEIRSTLEDGNVTDETSTVTHAWERLLCWLVTARGYKIKGV
jgi:lipopolysaccharide biosynthesis protein